MMKMVLPFAWQFGMSFIVFACACSTTNSKPFSTWFHFNNFCGREVLWNWFYVFAACERLESRRPDGSVGMALVLPALTDCRWFESLLVHSGVSSATRRKATGADKKKSERLESMFFGECDVYFSTTFAWPSFH